MRTRNLKPGFFENDKLGELEPLARILFAGLWCLADREGRLEYRPKKIKARILPYDDCDIEKLLQSLSPEFIFFYSVDGTRYIQIRNFTKHQHPHMKEEAICPAPEQTESNNDSIMKNNDSIATNNLPAPDKNQTSTIPAPDKNQTSTIPAPECSIRYKEEDIRYKEEGNKGKDKSEEEGKRKEVEEEKKKEAELSEEFEGWWEGYPNKQGKERAKQHYITRRKKGETKEELEQALKRYLAVKRKQNSQMFANGSTFLNPMPRGDSANISDFLSATLETMTDSERAELWRQQDEHRRFLESMSPEEKRRYYAAKGKHFKRFDGGDRLCEGGSQGSGESCKELRTSPL